VFIDAKDDRGGGDNWTTGAVSHAKLQSNHHHHSTNKPTSSFLCRPDALRVAQPTVLRALKGNISVTASVVNARL